MLEKREFFEKKLKDIEFALNESTIVAITDEKGIIIEVNQAFCRISQYSQEELIGQDHRILNSGYHLPTFFAGMWKTILRGKVWDGEVRNRAKDGSYYWVKTTIVPFLNDEGRPYQFISIRTDITEQKKVKEQLKESEQLLSTLIDVMPDFVCFKDAEGRWLKANDFALSLYRLQDVAYVGKTDQELLAQAEAQYCMVSDEQTWQQGQVSRVEEVVPQPHGENRTFDVIKVPVFHADGSRKGLVIVGRDITERKRAEGLNEYLAYTDPLTNLPNRRFFEEKLNEMLIQAKEKKEKLAVLYLDLDRFKYVNDILGHAMGDKILQMFSGLLLEIRGPKDFIARLGGDEFTILSPGIQDRNQVVELAKTLIQKLDQPYMIDDYELFIQTSIGISFFPDDGEDDQTIMKYADAALHRAKAEGRNKYRIYNPSIFSETKKTFAIEKELRLAVQKGEFHLHYQPKVDSKTGKISGAEALLRWNHAQWGMISPADFIPLAEDTGIIFSIGEWVMQTACRQSNAWRDQGLPIVPISINVSAKSFMHRDFVTIFKNRLEQWGTSSEQIEIEITESCLLHNPEEIEKTIQKLKAMGVKISLDDFGTGYSSLSYLKKFNMDTLKIDRSFIQDLDDPKVNTITTSIIQIAKGLNMRIVGEGVETLEQLKFLQAHQCEEIQGYLCSRPVSAEEFGKMLESEVCLL
ncbi:bifunctional diguanylate cyclase/phosphodiesterase [Ammoniphilus sp. YIM 78166]|uniref:sensor domain-containing protein n=1 Tax=Ammoniphilus sp. YIM 78166 TaxID=1644106 RepID=UPI0010706549|nr:bifunctional diguanylate cyclase/phosphodiesterase [Ammoniphilus sp. YIM 78166]